MGLAGVPPHLEPPLVGDGGVGGPQGDLLKRTSHREGGRPALFHD